MKKKIAILHAQIPFTRGGAELLVENLRNQLVQRGFETDIVSIPFKWFPNNCLLDCYTMWRLADVTQVFSEKIDLVIPMKVPTYMVSHPNKVIFLMHQFRAAYDLQDNELAFGTNTIPGGRELQKRIVAMDNLAFSEAKEIFSISKTVSKRLKKYNGYDSTPLYHPPGLAGKLYSEGYGDYILSIGRLDRLKRINLLIKAMQYCDPQITAIIGGKGSEFEELKKLARDIKVEDRVKFLGFVPDDEALRLYANAMGVYFAPIDEDYGYISLEAFLSQRPVVTCQDSGGVLEFVKNDINGYVVEPRPEAIAEAVNKLYRNKKTARDFGIAGYESVKDISWDNVIDELTKTIR